MSRVAIDTNILAYAEGVNGAARRAEALRLLRALPPDSVVVPVQALGELFHVLTRKAGRDGAAARAAVLGWADAYAIVDTSADVLIDATELAVDRRLATWDAMILAAAAKAGCRLLLSEDMQDGFTWRGVTVTNPFAATPHPILAALVASS